MRLSRNGDSARGERRAVARSAGVLATVVVGAVGAWWTWSDDGAAPKLHAEGGLTDDSDGDGLSDGLELALGTRADRADSDLDGFADAEELARGSSPTAATSIPGADETALSMDAYRERDKVHLVTAIYLPDGNPHGKALNFVTIKSGAIAPVPSSVLRGGGPIRSVATRDSGGRVFILDPIVPVRSVTARGGMALAATIADTNGYLAADAANLSVVDGEIFQQIILGYSSLQPEPVASVGLGIGGVYRPIGTGNPNSAYVLGQICAQSTIVIGVVGALVTQEVVQADCVPGWDAHCSPGCSATVGSTIKTIDPAALIGG